MEDGMTEAGDGLNQLSVEILIQAPSHKVWEAMTGQMEQWWCPRPWRTEIIEQDWRAGGRAAMVLHGPEGERHDLEGLFLEVTPGVRFVTTDAVNSRMEPRGPFMIGIWELIPQGDATLYRASARHWTAEAMRQHADMGFEQGWQVCAQQLKALVEGQ